MNINLPAIVRMDSYKGIGDLATTMLIEFGNTVLYSYLGFDTSTRKFIFVAYDMDENEQNSLQPSTEQVKELLQNRYISIFDLVDRAYSKYSLD